MKQLRLQTGRPRQRGASLVVVLLILIVVTLLGAGAAQMSLLAERTTRSDRDRQIALQAAEAALEDAWNDINSSNVAARAALFATGSKQGFISGCNNGTTTQGLCLPSVTGKSVWFLVDFMQTSTPTNTVALGQFTGRANTFGSGSGLVPAQAPRYIIEILNDTSAGAPVGAVVYRVTAMGFGPTVDAKVVLQGEFRKKI